jgi:oxygen-independent coproporphyrinogen-3 oxidase
MAERGEVAKPGEDIQTEMYLAACEALEDAGHAGYEISNFAKPGRECRHNLNYWRQGGYVGLGVSAHSHISGRRWVNIDDITSYIGGIKAGGEVISGETVLSEADMAREEVMLGLRTAEGIDLTTLAERHGHDFARNIESVSIRLEGGGLVRLEGKSVYLTRAGALVSNTVITEFF